jgi:hypothetical protein
MSTGAHGSRRGIRATVIAVCAGLVGAAALAFAAVVVTHGPGVLAVDPHGTALPTERHVQISRAMPAPSDTDGLHARLVSGTMPHGRVTATVLTDEQCAPDSQGISHCLNRLRLEDGSEIAVRHPHDMGRVACLAPGETVQLLPPRA